MYSTRSMDMAYSKTWRFGIGMESGSEGMGWDEVISRLDSG